MHHFIYDLLILAAKKSSAAPPADADVKSYSLSWAVVGIGLIVGLLVTLAPTKRVTEIKRGRHD